MRFSRRLCLISSVILVVLAGVAASFVYGPAKGEVRPSLAEAGDSTPSVLILESDGLRYTYHVISGSEALFDVSQDPGSLRNLLPGRAADAARLRRTLEASLRVASLEDLREAHRQKIEELKALGYL